jgi:hypothetical protein
MISEGIMNIFKSTAILFTAWILLSNVSHAATRIAVLAFELNDITSLPNTPQEQQRTASMQNLLEKALSDYGQYEIIHIDPKEQAKANSSFGYLFNFDDQAAKLAEEVNADWVIVGQHSKPSFLFSYLIAHLINVKEQTLKARYAIELKGTDIKVSERGVKSLAKKINESIYK